MGRFIQVAQVVETKRIVVVLCAIFSICTARLDPATTPPMGWRSWNSLLNGIDDKIILSQARALASAHKLRAVGYNRVGIDGGWVCQNPSTPRGLACTCGGVNGSYHDYNGNPVVGSGRFPNLTQLVSEVHALGLRIDFYGNSCNCAAAERKVWPGGNVDHDIAAFGSYMMDGIKVDGCGPAHNISRWVEALDKLPTESPLLLENCGDNHDRWSPPDIKAIRGNAHCGFQMYRISADIAPQFYSTMYNLQAMLPYTNYSRPGCWPYPDMLMVGRKELSPVETRSHFAAWCISSSPLVLGHDMTDRDSMAVAEAVAGNPMAVQINQAYFGHGGGLLQQSAEHFEAFALHGAGGTGGSNTSLPVWQIWRKPLSHNGSKFAVLMLNLHPAERDISLSMKQLGYSANAAVSLKDVWTGDDRGRVKGDAVYVARKIPGHGSVFLVTDILDPK